MEKNKVLKDYLQTFISSLREFSGDRDLEDRDVVISHLVVSPYLVRIGGYVRVGYEGKAMQLRGHYQEEFDKKGNSIKVESSFSVEDMEETERKQTAFDILQSL